MFDTPTIAADHETIKRDLLTSINDYTIQALKGVEAFYRERNSAPDIKILDLYTYLGDNDKAALLRQQFRRSYPYETNFIFH